MNLNYVCYSNSESGQEPPAIHIYSSDITYPFYAESSLTMASFVRPGDVKANASESLLSSITSIHFIPKILNGVHLKIRIVYYIKNV